MLVSLIGAFVTASGILLSADTSVSSHKTGAAIGLERKIEVTGKFSAAAINGQLQWSGDVSADFLRVFRQVSKTLRGSGPLSVRGQLNKFAAATKAEAERNARPGMERYLYEDGALLTVTMAGFDDRRPIILAFTLFLDTTTSSNTALRFRVEEHTIPRSGCWWLAGSRAAALGLINDDPRFPAVLRQDPAVLAVRTVRTSPCDALTEAEARAFFQIAVHATSDYGREFGIRSGEVGKPVDVLPITRAGAGRIRRLD